MMLMRFTAIVTMTALFGGCAGELASGDRSDVSEVTYCRDIAPIVLARCATCHRPGEAAPFSLLTYDDVRRRAGQIADVTQKRFMPPWLPKEGHGDFVGARRLTDDEIARFRKWADTGMVRGDEADLPAAPKFTAGWQLGTPDLELTSAPYTLSAQGSDVFRNFVIDTGLDAPRWVKAIELRPTNPRVTHHARLGLDRSNESVRRDAADPAPGYEGMAWGQDPDGQLVIWAPGTTGGREPLGVAWRLQPGTQLVLHTHMQPAGKPEIVQFKIGIHFASEPPRRHPIMLRIGSRDIDLRAGDTSAAVADEYTLPIDVDVNSIFPHAHSLCREIHVTAELPDGSQKPLIWIERFDENWHEMYGYAEPVRLPRGTKLRSTFRYDNSDGNVRNRHRPARRVVHGSNADDEMADVYLQVTAVQPDQRAVLKEDYTQYELRSQLVGFRKTLEARPNDPWSQEGLAACHFGLGQPAEAIRVLEKRLAGGANDVFPLVSLGLARGAVGDFARAEEHHRRALERDGDYPLAWLGLGKALVGQNKGDAAEKAIRRAIAIAPGLTDAHNNLAEILVRRGQLDEAADACSAAIESSPDNAPAYLKLAEIRARQKRFDDSLQVLRTAHGIAPYIHPPKVLLAVYCFQNNEADRAGRLLQEARDELPSHPVPELFLGQVARQGQQWETARRHLAAAHSLPLPENWPDSHKRRFVVLLQTERLHVAQHFQDATMALDALSKWLEAEPGNKQARQLYDRFRGNAAR
jgi:tetratricopeptide (TPR) repeat protein